MKLTKFSSVVGGVTLLAAAAIVSAPSAQADAPTPAWAESSIGTLDSFEMETNDGRPRGGRVLFHPDGDHLQLWDQQDEGKNVEIDVWNVTHDPNTKEYGFYNRLDEEDSFAEVNGSDGQPWNMAEGHCFRFRIRLVDENTTNVVEGSADFAQWRNNNGETDKCDGVN